MQMVGHIIYQSLFFLSSPMLNLFFPVVSFVDFLKFFKIYYSYRKPLLRVICSNSCLMFSQT